MRDEAGGALPLSFDRTSRCSWDGAAALPHVRLGKKYTQRVDGVDLRRADHACVSWLRSVGDHTMQGIAVHGGGPCGRRYRNRVRRLIRDGIELVPIGAAVLFTVTAPSETGSHCRRHKRCQGGGWDYLPCPCSPAGGVDLADWNASLTKRMNRLLEAVRRGEASPMVGGAGGVLWLSIMCKGGKFRSEERCTSMPCYSRDRTPLQLDRKALRELVMRHGLATHD